MRYLKMVSVLLLASYMLYACGKLPKPCTLEYRIITVKVKHEDGSPARLDTSFTVRQSNADTFFFQRYDSTSLYHRQGEYELMGDESGERKEFFTFYGITRGDTLVKEPYVFDLSGCHLSLVSGKNELVIP